MREPPDQEFLFYVLKTHTKVHSIKAPLFMAVLALYKYSAEQFKHLCNWFVICS